MKPVVMVVGRMNPITDGHRVLVDFAETEARRIGGQVMVFIVDGVETSKDKAKNPLSGEARLAYFKELFPGVNVDLAASAWEALEIVDIQGLRPALWIAGSDRASKYQRLLDFYGLGGKVFEVDREAGEADGVSATAARKAALEGNWEVFRSQMPKRAPDALLVDLMNRIQEESGIGRLTCRNLVDVSTGTPHQTQGVA